MLKRVVIFILFLTAFQSCNTMEYSPNQAFDSNTPQNLNIKNIEKLVNTEGDDTIRFVLTGDSQREYTYSKKLVETINRIPNVDFVFLAGDISDFGLLQEFEWVNEIFSKLKMPYIGVIGNHDLVANGEAVFKRMFGDLNFNFVYKGVKFVCYDTNSREREFNGNVPDLKWLAEEMKPQEGVSAYISVAHVPPTGGDFDQNLIEEYIQIVNGSPNTLASLYAHNHSQSIFYPNGQNIPYIVTDAIEHRKFILVEIVNGKLTYHDIEY